MSKVEIGEGQYVVYANNAHEANLVIGQELARFDKIKYLISQLVTENGQAWQNFMTNISEERLNIHFNDATSLIYDNPDNATTKGEVRHQRNSDGKALVDDEGNFKYELAYRYPEIQGHNADFRLAHEMGHLMLNPSNAQRYILDKESHTIHVSGLIRQGTDKQFYGKEMQENAINLIAQLALRDEHTADDIIMGKADVSEFNSYKKCDNLIKLLAVAMRNDFDEEISFEQLMEQKIDSMIELPDGSKEPANTFFYGILNDSSIIQKEFDKYMGKGAWKQLNDAFTQLYDQNINKERFENIFNAAQGLIYDFANVRFQYKYKEAVARNGDNTPSLENKINMINEIVGIQQTQSPQTVSMEMQFPEGYSINEFGEIIRPAGPEINNEFSLMQKIAQLLRKSDMLMNISFVEKFVNKQLNVLSDTTLQRNLVEKGARESFINWLSNNGEHRNLPPVQRLSDPERMARMERKMQQDQSSKENDGRG